jgi:methionyl-tRNA formyltransferase
MTKKDLANSNQTIIPTPAESPLVQFNEEISNDLKRIKIKDRLKIIFFGTPEFVLPVVSRIDQYFDLIGVVTTPDAPVGRRQVMTSTPIAQCAEKLSIPSFKPENLDDELVQQLSSLQPDLFVVASYGKIIPQSILDIPKYGSINIHPSKLPLFRGATPIQSQILEGINSSAISFILVDAKMDHGPLLHQEPFEISNTDTNATLHDSMFQKSADVLTEVIENYISGKIKPIDQDHDNATFCKPFNRDSGYFALDTPPSPEQLDRMIRAFYPWPTAWTIWKFKVQNSKFKNNEMKIKFLPDGLVQPEGKKPMKWKEFLNGYRDFPKKDLLN